MNHFFNGSNMQKLTFHTHNFNLNENKTVWADSRGKPTRGCHSQIQVIDYDILNKINQTEKKGDFLLIMTTF